MSPSEWFRCWSPALLVPVVMFCMPAPGAAAGPTFTEYPLASGSAPYDIIPGPDNALWFTEHTSNKIGRITVSGSVTEYATPTASSAPGGIVTGPDGNLWFTEENSNKIGRVTTSGTFTEYTIPTAASLPAGIAAGPDGNLWFTEYAANAEKIGRITPAGVITEWGGLAGGSRAAPWGIVEGPDGAMWFAEAYGNRIGRITTAGVLTEYALPSGALNPIWIALGPDGAMWFTEQGSNQIGRITTAGVISEYSVPTAASYPNFGIAAGPDGAIYFNEGTGNNIGRVTTAGVITEYAVPTSGSYPGGIAAGSDGAMWFAEYNGNKIGRMTVAGATCVYTLSSTSQSVAAAGAGISVTVTAGTGCAWTAASNASWITVSAGSSGTGNGTVSLQAAANTGSARTGTVTIAGQTFTVNQAAVSVSCTYALSPATASVAAAGGSGTATVTAGTGCTWTAASSVSWITTSSSGSGNGTINYTVAANTAAAARSGAITAGGQSLSITQAAAVATPPVLTDGGVVNAGDFSSAIAPGSMVSIFGQNLAAQTTAASVVPLPVTLAGVSVEITDATGTVTAPPLYFVSPQQINFQMPFGLGSSNVSVNVVTSGGTSNTETLFLDPVAPRLFTWTSGGQTTPILLHAADYSFVTAAAPAMPGEYVILLLTGLGAVNPQIAAGSPGGDNAANGPVNLVVAPVSLTLGGFDIAPVFAGLMPDLAGVYQVNFQVPASLAPGSYPLYVTGDTATSQDGVLSNVGTTLPVAGTAPVGTGGGTVQGGGLSATVPAGVFTASTPVTIYEDTSLLNAANGDLSPGYLVTGLPASNAAAIPFAITLPAAPPGSVDVALTMQPSFEGGSGTTYLAGQAQGSQVTFTLPATADTASSLAAPGGAAGPVAQATQTATTGVGASGQFQVISRWATVMSPGKNVQLHYTGTTQQAATALAPYFDEAFTKQTALGLDWTWRSLPVAVYVEPFEAADAELYGYETASVFGPNWASDELNATFINQLGVGAEFEGTAGHELFHVLQEHYDPRGNWDKASSGGTWLWYHEALSTWFETIMVGDPTYVPSTLKGANFYFFTRTDHGLEFGTGATKDQQEHGYGASMFLTYLTTEHNDNTIPAKVLQLEAAQGNPPMAATQALAQTLGGVPALSAEWKGFLEAWSSGGSAAQPSQTGLFGGTFPAPDATYGIFEATNTLLSFKSETDTGFSPVWNAPALSGQIYHVYWAGKTTWTANTNNLVLEVEDPVGEAEGLVYVYTKTGVWRLLTKLTGNTPYLINNAEQFPLAGESLVIVLVNGISAKVTGTTAIQLLVTPQPATPPAPTTYTSSALNVLNVPYDTNIQMYVGLTGGPLALASSQTGTATTPFGLVFASPTAASATYTIRVVLGGTFDYAPLGSFDQDQPTYNGDFSFSKNYVVAPGQTVNASFTVTVESASGSVLGKAVVLTVTFQPSQ